MKNEIRIREATADDLSDLAEISRTTWYGHDYLEGVSKKRIDQQGFFIINLSRKL